MGGDTIDALVNAVRKAVLECFLIGQSEEHTFGGNSLHLELFVHHSFRNIGAPPFGFRGCPHLCPEIADDFFGGFFALEVDSGGCAD